MAVTIDTPQRIDSLTWRVTWSSDLGAGTVFYVWLNGELVSTGTETSTTVVAAGGSFPSLFITDDEDETPGGVSNGHFTIAWDVPSGAEQMIIESQAAGAGTWSTVQTLDVTGGDAIIFFTTGFLADATGYIYAAKAVDGAGNISTRSLAHFPMVRLPDVPEVEMTYSDISGLVTITSDLVPGENTFWLYKGEDGPVDYASAWEEITAFPHVTAALDLSTITRLTVRQKNPWRLESQNDNPTVFDIDGDGAAQTEAPSDPEQITITPSAGGTMLVEALYFAGLDGYVGPGNSGSAADTWAIWITSDGSTPDPSDPETDTEAMILSTGVPKLEFTTAAFSDGATIKVLVRVRRTADTRDSANTAIAQAVADATAPDAPELNLTQTGPGQGGEAVIDALYQDADNYVTAINWEPFFGGPALRFYLGGDLVMQIDTGGVRIKGIVIEGGAAPGTSHTDEIEHATGFWHFAGGSPLTRRWSLNADGNLSVPGGVVEVFAYPWNADGLPDTYAANWDVIANDLIFSPDLSREAAIFRDDDNKLYARSITEGAF